ncbi:S-layer homology domain-containing protein [Calditerricola satsumensis]|uniref:S-layer homology domain-containing protein n=1 Tax=Calditerricola satsumensis TaxID=373054 RepID=UPI0006D01711|nr:S-layer homology domain-containing protein [Calditerricola satsumensis]
MDVKKKVLAGALASSLVLSSITPAFAANLSDIEKSYARAEIQALVEAGIISGYPDGTFKPTAKITRAEFAKVLAKRWA